MESSPLLRARTDGDARRPSWLVPVLGAIVLFLVGFVVLLWQLDLLRTPKGGPNSRTVAAVFALLGAVFTAAVTLVGLLLKHSIDTRTLEMAKQTHERLEQENHQAEARLRVETAIRAVELLATKVRKACAVDSTCRRASRARPPRSAGPGPRFALRSMAAR